MDVYHKILVKVFEIMLEEFSASPSKDKFSVIEKRFAELSSIISRIAAKF